MPHALDDIEFVTRLDPKGMLGLTEAFPAQCRRALEIAEGVELPALPVEPSLVMLTGLGGSAAGGDFVRAVFEASGNAPFVVNRDYFLPSYAGPDTVVFVVSYSGNTEETLSAYADARRKGCQIFAVTSGGKLAEFARADGVTVILVPGGQPPRTALGFLLIPVLSACQRLGLIPAQPFEQAFRILENCAKAWGMQTPFEDNPTKRLAEALHGKLAVLYGLGSWQGVVAGRWKAQINENAKNHAFAHTFPELNHNEIIGWEGWSMRVRLDEDTLKTIANITRGEYFYAGTATDLKKVYQGMNSKMVLQKQQSEITALFVAAAAVFVLLGAGFSFAWFNRLL